MKNEAIEHQIEVYRGYAATYPEDSPERKDCSEAADQMEAELTAMEAEDAAMREALSAIAGPCEKIFGGKRCIDEPQYTIGAEFGADAACYPCIANAALSPPTGKVLVSLDELRAIEIHEEQEHGMYICPVCKAFAWSCSDNVIHEDDCWLHNTLKAHDA